MRSDIVFDESSWSKIEPLLPDDVLVKRVVLEDFIWFMGRNKKYKSTEAMIEDYIRHIQLKANPVFDVRPNESQAFKRVDIRRLRDELRNKFE